MAGFTVTASDITDTGVTISVAASISQPEEEGNIVITVTSSGTQVATQSVTPSGEIGEAVTATFTGLNPSTGYTAAFSSTAGDGSTTFTTLADQTPKTATVGQWEDLADRVQSKAEIGTVVSTPSNVAYVGTNNIVNGAITENKLDINYSTSEQITGKKWIDGKAIYKKTVNFGALPNSTTKTVPHGISNMSSVVHFEGIASSPTGNYTTIPIVPSVSTALCDCSINSTEIKMTAFDDRSAWDAFVTIYYTKSL